MSYKLFTIRDHSGQDQHQWAQRSLDDELAICQDRTLAKIFDRYLPKDGLILEAGCGLGGWVKWINNRGLAAIGLDWYPEIVARARALGVDVRQGDITNLNDFQTGSVAAYISLGVIEHFEAGPAPAVNEAFRVLRKGGVAIFTTPANTFLRTSFVHPLRSLVLMLYRAGGRKAFFGEYRFSLKELCDHVRNSGFEILDTDLDEIREDNCTRHIGLFADFPFLRDTAGHYALNTMGRAVLRILRTTMPRSAYSSAYCVVARKPAT